MNFSEFVNKLYLFCGNGETPSNFLVAILTAATTEQDDDIFDRNNDYLKKIFNGKREISKKSVSYILTHLDKGKLDTYIYDLLAEDALIELCDAFEEQIGNTTKDDVTTKLSELFVSLMKKIATKEKGTTITAVPTTANNIDIEKALAEIVKNLANTPQEKLYVILKYEPYNVDKKILSKNALLRKDIREDVINYYSYIETLYKEISKGNTALFDRVCEAIKYASDNYISQELPQQVVFDFMVAWLKQKSMSSNETACRIMISFFVQNCEVFHEIT